MQNESRVQPHEITELLREARRLVAGGGTEAEWSAYMARKQDLVDRILAERCGGRAGEPR